MLHGDRSRIIIATGIHLQPPESFNFQTPDKWPHWKKCFEKFRIASGLGTKSKEHQINTLLYSLEEESNHVLTSTCITNDKRKNYKHVLENLTVFSKPKEMLFLSMHCLTDDNKLREKLQNSTSRHCTYHLASNCNYGDLQDKKEQFAVKTATDRCRSNTRKYQESIQQKESVHGQQSVLNNDTLPVPWMP